jgi:hypothetical protein
MDTKRERRRHKYTRNANHWTKDIVSIDGLDKPGNYSQNIGFLLCLESLGG